MLQKSGVAVIISGTMQIRPSQRSTVAENTGSFISSPEDRLSAKERSLPSADRYERNKGVTLDLLVRTMSV